MDVVKWRIFGLLPVKSIRTTLWWPRGNLLACTKTSSQPSCLLPPSLALDLIFSLSFLTNYALYSC